MSFNSNQSITLNPITNNFVIFGSQYGYPHIPNGIDTLSLDTETVLQNIDLPTYQLSYRSKNPSLLQNYFFNSIGGAINPSTSSNIYTSAMLYDMSTNIMIFFLIPESTPTQGEVPTDGSFDVTGSIGNILSIAENYNTTNIEDVYFLDSNLAVG